MPKRCRSYFNANLYSYLYHITIGKLFEVNQSAYSAIWRIIFLRELFLEMKSNEQYIRNSTTSLYKAG
ncbi:putative histidinol-phosphatase [Trichinella pseudospiralis]